MSSDLSRRAFKLRREIEHILATVPPHEIPGRIEDVAHDAFDEVERGTRREVRREFSEM